MVRASPTPRLQFSLHLWKQRTPQLFPNTRSPIQPPHVLCHACKRSVRKHHAYLTVWRRLRLQSGLHSRVRGRVRGYPLFSESGNFHMYFSTYSHFDPYTRSAKYLHYRLTANDPTDFQLYYTDPLCVVQRSESGP